MQAAGNGRLLLLTPSSDHHPTTSADSNGRYRLLWACRRLSSACIPITATAATASDACALFFLPDVSQQILMRCASCKPILALLTATRSTSSRNRSMYTSSSAADSSGLVFLAYLLLLLLLLLPTAVIILRASI